MKQSYGNELRRTGAEIVSFQNSSSQDDGGAVHPGRGRAMDAKVSPVKRPTGCSVPAAPSCSRSPTTRALSPPPTAHREPDDATLRLAINCDGRVLSCSFPVKLTGLSPSVRSTRLHQSRPYARGGTGQHLRGHRALPGDAPAGGLDPTGSCEIADVERNPMAALPGISPSTSQRLASSALTDPPEREPCPARMSREASRDGSTARGTRPWDTA